MKIIITSGGTEEQIDNVRKITNTSTGKLGSIIAKTFYDFVPNIEIIYICSYNAIVPDIKGIKVIKVKNVANLQNTLENILNSVTIDIVIHAMAVSDYSVSKITTLEDISSSLSQKIYENKHNLQNYNDIYNFIYSELEFASNNKNENKISSSFDHLVMVMKKTPKIINIIKKLQPNTILVGFKLLVNVKEQDLIKVGYNLLISNSCDFVLANDLNNITSSYHKGILISPDSTYISFNSKEEIAEGIVKNVILKVRGE